MACNSRGGMLHAPIFLPIYPFHPACDPTHLGSVSFAVPSKWAGAVEKAAEELREFTSKDSRFSRKMTTDGRILDLSTYVTSMDSVTSIERQIITKITLKELDKETVLIMIKLLAILEEDYNKDKVPKMKIKSAAEILKQRGSQYNIDQTKSPKSFALKKALDGWWKRINR